MRKTNILRKPDEIYDILNESWTSNNFTDFRHNVNYTEISILDVPKRNVIVHETAYTYYEEVMEGHNETFLPIFYEEATQQTARTFHILSDLNKMLSEPLFSAQTLYKTAISYTFCQDPQSVLNAYIDDVPTLLKYPSKIKGYTTLIPNNILKDLLPITNKVTHEIIDPYKDMRELIIGKVLDSLVYHNPFHIYTIFISKQYVYPETNKFIEREFMHVLHKNPYYIHRVSLPQMFEYHQLKVEESREALDHAKDTWEAYIDPFQPGSKNEKELFKQEYIKQTKSAWQEAVKEYNKLRQTDKVYNEYMTQYEKTGTEL